MNFKLKYLKYKNKYINLQKNNMTGGGDISNTDILKKYITFIYENYYTLFFKILYNYIIKTMEFIFTSFTSLNIPNEEDALQKFKQLLTAAHIELRNSNEIFEILKRFSLDGINKEIIIIENIYNTEFNNFFNVYNFIDDVSYNLKFKKYKKFIENFIASINSASLVKSSELTLLPLFSTALSDELKINKILRKIVFDNNIDESNPLKKYEEFFKTELIDNIINKMTKDYRRNMDTLRTSIINSDEIINHYTENKIQSINEIVEYVLNHSESESINTDKIKQQIIESMHFGDHFKDHFKDHITTEKFQDLAIIEYQDLDQLIKAIQVWFKTCPNINEIYNAINFSKEEVFDVSKEELVDDSTHTIKTIYTLCSGRFKFKPIDNDGSGDCLLYSIIQLLKYNNIDFTKINIDTVRSFFFNIFDYIFKNLQVFEYYQDLFTINLGNIEGTPSHEYKVALRTNHNWLTQVTVTLLGALLNKNIGILSVYTNNKIEKINIISSIDQKDIILTSQLSKILDSFTQGSDILKQMMMDIIKYRNSNNDLIYLNGLLLCTNNVHWEFLKPIEPIT